MMQASSYIQPAAVVSRRGGLRQQAVVKYSDSQFIADAAVEMSRRVDALARDIICKVGSEHRGWKRQLYELHGLSELSHGNTVRARIRKCANSHSMICAAYQQTQEKLLADAVSGVSSAASVASTLASGSTPAAAAGGGAVVASVDVRLGEAERKGEKVKLEVSGSNALLAGCCCAFQRPPATRTAGRARLVCMPPI